MVGVMEHRRWTDRGGYFNGYTHDVIYIAEEETLLEEREGGVRDIIGLKCEVDNTRLY